MSYAEFCAGIAARDGTECFVRRVLVARREALIEAGHRMSAAAQERWPDAPPGSIVPYLPDGLLACDGQPDGHHLIAKQHIKREFARAEFPHRVVLRPGEAVSWESLDAMLSDPRCGIAACRRHHDLVERALVRLFREELPEHVFEFARDVGLGWRLERDYPLREAAA